MVEKLTVTGPGILRLCPLAPSPILPSLRLLLSSLSLRSSHSSLLLGACSLYFSFGKNADLPAERGKSGLLQKISWEGSLLSIEMCGKSVANHCKRDTSRKNSEKGIKTSIEIVKRSIETVKQGKLGVK